MLYIMAAAVICPLAVFSATLMLPAGPALATLLLLLRSPPSSSLRSDSIVSITHTYT